MNSNNFHNFSYVRVDFSMNEMSLLTSPGVEAVLRLQPCRLAAADTPDREEPPPMLLSEIR